METHNLSLTKQLAGKLWNVVYFGDLLQVPLKEYVHEEMMFLLMQIYHLCQEEDKELAMATYRYNKKQLLQLQVMINNLMHDANKRQRKRIEDIADCFKGLLELLEEVKEKRME